MEKIALIFAKANGFNCVDYLGKWKKMDVFMAIPESIADMKDDDEPPNVGKPQFIIVKNDNAQWAYDDAINDIMRHFNK